MTATVMKIVMKMNDANRQQPSRHDARAPGTFCVKRRHGYALASAQVYFSCPRDLFASVVDSRREIGNLFSPYWQARLVETPCSVRQRVAVFSGAIAPCIPGRD